jgi:hypothetical protein
MLDNVCLNRRAVAFWPHIARSGSAAEALGVLVSLSPEEAQGRLGGLPMDSVPATGLAFSWTKYGLNGYKADDPGRTGYA